MHFYSGTSGLVLPVKNKTEYPEQHRDKSRLHFYSTLFNSIEINSSFYKLPQKKTVERWATEVTGGFHFTFKISKEITHCPNLDFNPAAVRNFFEVIDVPADKRACLLIQFPGKTSTDFLSPFRKLMRLVVKLNEKYQWKLAVEFRHISWYNPSTIKLLKLYGAASVIHDFKTFTMNPMYESEIMYLRFHGTEKNYRGSYSNEFLQDYASTIKRWMNEGRDVYAYFNNTLGPAAANLLQLNELVRK